LHFIVIVADLVDTYKCNLHQWCLNIFL